MKTLFIIGNGFDVNLGLKTRYSDFYKFYEQKKSDYDVVNNLKLSIAKNINFWSDLEFALGKYTLNINSRKEFELMFEDIGDNLAEYLTEVENNFDPSQFVSEKIHECFAFPENYLLPTDKSIVQSFKNQWKGTMWGVSVITLNYTQTLEKIINYTSQRIQIGSHHNHAIFLNRIEHIHGYMNNRMVMGVNDFSQISNKDLQKDQQVIEAFVKDNCNNVQKHNIEKWCKDQIKEANLICIFGSSLGETDNLYWQQIGEQLKKDCRLIIFAKGKDISDRRKYKIGEIERVQKSSFLNKTNLKDEEKAQVYDKIFIGVNTKIFKTSKRPAANNSFKKGSDGD